MAGNEWPCTADEIIHQRDVLAQSWRNVAIALGLGADKKARGRWAKMAYEELTGRDPQESRPTGVRRQPQANGTAVVTAPRPQVRRLQWDDDTDQGEIEQALQGDRKETKDGVAWVPVRITVEHETYGHAWSEEIHCRFATEFTYGPEGDQPLQVTVVENVAGASRTLYVSDIARVR